MGFTTVQREKLALQVTCPKCNAQPYFRCRAPRVQVTYLRHPHLERIAEAMETIEIPGEG